eukprot:365663-Chlamydomonas_euryale.AAC.14
MAWQSDASCGLAQQHGCPAQLNLTGTVALSPPSEPATSSALDELYDSTLWEDFNAGFIAVMAVFGSLQLITLILVLFLRSQQVSNVLAGQLCGLHD